MAKKTETEKPKIEIIKEAYANFVQNWSTELADAEKEKNAAEAVVDSCENEIQAALKEGSPEKYVDAKARQKEALELVSYYNAQVERVEKEREMAVEGMAPVINDIYRESLEAYRAACSDCVDKINALTEASDRAAAIALGYDAAINFFRCEVEHKQDVLGGSVPLVFPNRLAFDLTKKLQYQLFEMKKFIDGR